MIFGENRQKRGRSHKPSRIHQTDSPPPSSLRSDLSARRHCDSLLPLLDSISRLIKDRWSERTPSRSFQWGRVSVRPEGGVTSADSNRFHETASPIMDGRVWFSFGSGKSILRFHACLLITSVFVEIPNLIARPTYVRRFSRLSKSLRE